MLPPINTSEEFPKTSDVGCQQPVISLEGLLQKVLGLGPQAGLKLPPACADGRGGRGQTCIHSLLGPHVAFLPAGRTAQGEAGLTVSLLTNGGSGCPLLPAPDLACLVL